VLFLFCAAAASGTFVMASDVLAAMYPGIGCYVRALGLVGCELAFGHASYALIRSGRTGSGLACGVIVLLCALAEMGLAGTQGDVVARLKQDVILSQDAKAQAPAVAVAVSTDIPGGPQKTQEILQAQADARHEAQAEAERQRLARERTQAQRLKLTMQRTQLETLLPILLALLGACAAACTTPLLELSFTR
jgi:hypothetical protein